LVRGTKFSDERAEHEQGAIATRPRPGKSVQLTDLSGERAEHERGAMVTRKVDRMGVRGE
jgi:hypothetical protein